MQWHKGIKGQKKHLFLGFFMRRGCFSVENLARRGRQARCGKGSGVRIKPKMDFREILRKILDFYIGV